MITISFFYACVNLFLSYFHCQFLLNLIFETSVNSVPNIEVIVIRDLIQQMKIHHLLFEILPAIPKDYSNKKGILFLTVEYCQVKYLLIHIKENFLNTRLHFLAE
jgi:hypothetical protein